jgi:hypothetical protein
MTNPPIPIGLMTIIQVVDVRFLTFAGKFSWRYPHRKIVNRHKERMMAWRPTELHEFLRRMLGEDEK